MDLLAPFSLSYPATEPCFCCVAVTDCISLPLPETGFNSLLSFYNGTPVKPFDWLGGRASVLIHFLPVATARDGSVLIG